MSSVSFFADASRPLFLYKPCLKSFCHLSPSPPEEGHNNNWHFKHWQKKKKTNNDTSWYLYCRCFYLMFTCMHGLIFFMLYSYCFLFYLISSVTHHRCLNKLGWDHPNSILFEIFVTGQIHVKVLYNRFSCDIRMSNPVPTKLCKISLCSYSRNSWKWKWSFVKHSQWEAKLVLCI